jgi:thiol-disulfide isomerase/thioredoxin
LRALIPCLLAATLIAGGCDRAKQAPEQASQASSDATSASPDEVLASSDEVPPSAHVTDPDRAIDRSHKGAAVPEVSFTSPEGEAVTLADFAGKPVLLNLWATWCAPCVAELPTLDALAVREGDAVEVLTVSQDLDTAKVVPFLKKTGVAHLPAYTDPKLALSLAYQANLPTTVLIDSTGHEVWRITGGIDWTGEKAAALIAEAG